MSPRRVPLPLLLLPLALWSAACTGELLSLDQSEQQEPAPVLQDMTSPARQDMPSTASEDMGSARDLGEEEPAAGPIAMPIRHITPLQYRNMVYDLFGGRLDTALFNDADKNAALSRYSTEPAANRSTERSVQQLLDAAEEIAVASVDLMPQLLPCAAQPMNDACFDAFLDRYPRRAFRRPLTLEEREALRAAYDEALTDGFSEHEALATALSMMLQMPQFLYVTEVGEARAQEPATRDLTDHEVAQRLALFFLDSIPDQELQDAADKGELRTVEQIEAQARRLLREHPDASILKRLVQEWLHLEDRLEKDEARFPQFTPALEASIREELRRAFALAITQGDSLEALLTMSRLPIDAELASFYGIEAGFVPGQDGWATMELPEHYQGLIARPYFLATHASTTSSSHVKRGYTLLKQLLCSPTGSPPPDAMSRVPIYPEGATSRQKSEILRQEPACSACHQMIDNIGLSLEHYDALGQWRDLAPESEGGVMIDDRGEIVRLGAVGQTDVAGEQFSGQAGLTALLTASRSVQECIPRQWFRYAIGRLEQGPEDERVIRELVEAFQGREQSLQELLIAITRTEAFRTRALQQ